MAKNIKRCWGIDIGQCAIKALRCTLEGDQIVADAFDYIEYPKILSQPEAEPEQLVKEALETFLSRNEISRRDDKVAISVPGQSGLTKFFKPPPVDVKRLPDICRFEAKQQIPFPLEEVIWDFQQLPGGQVIDGFAIDTEVGLFAMKRDQVHRALRPFNTADIQLDLVQLAPISIYNFVTHDILTDGPDEDMFDPDDPPESIVVLAMGTDATDLVVTNGFRMWQRSIPLGGNHFTKQLTKELKLTFAKAEHLKRNARQAEDPKTVFQAMRPIFNDLVTEVQRSIGFFQGIDRKAKIRGVVLLGNTVKLPGLQQYISKNLGYDVLEFDSFNELSGASVIGSPQFSENVLAYGVSYGLCLQGLGKARLSTSLLPREILTKRAIKAKKPWAVASVGALLLACSFNFFFHYNVWSKVKADYKENGVAWNTGESKITQVKQTSDGYIREHADKEAQQAFVREIGEEVVGSGDRRLLWLELMTALNKSLPWPEGVEPGEYVDYKTLPMDERPVLYIDYIESEYFPDLTTWYTPRVANAYFELKRHLKANSEGRELEETETAEAGENPDQLVEGAEQFPGPQGPGWVIELAGHHYFNKDRKSGGLNHIRNTILKFLEEESISLPINAAGDLGTFTMKELGISHPILALDGGEPKTVRVANPDAQTDASVAGGNTGMYGSGMYGGEGSDEAGYGSGGGAAAYGQASGGVGSSAGVPGAEEAEPVPAFFEVKETTFTIQFCWTENTLSERLAAQEEAARLKKEADEAAAALAPNVEENAVETEDAAPANGASPDAVPADGAPADAVPADAVPADAVPADAVPADAAAEPVGVEEAGA
ncbi:MAG: type IV pilus assembly protein PilM [Planctomycetaceae bacterium]|nr:type IV pilus assembly protein PilM [Planctomycetales bacterium]MCB9926951.1 type IV pilus assembly protein PilM [Planctomycetaceae bacterium]